MIAKWKTQQGWKVKRKSPRKWSEEKAREMESKRKDKIWGPVRKAQNPNKRSSRKREQKKIERKESSKNISGTFARTDGRELPIERDHTRHSGHKQAHARHANVSFQNIGDTEILKLPERRGKSFIQRNKKTNGSKKIFSNTGCCKTMEQDFKNYEGMFIPT